MSYRYENTEGASFETDEIRPDLEVEARWTRTDTETGASTNGVPAPDYSADPGVLQAGIVSPNIGGAAVGQEVTGGPFHLTSVTAGAFPPQEVLSADEAVERAREQLAAAEERQRDEAAAREKAETTAREAHELEQERARQAALEESAKLGATASAARAAGDSVGRDAQVQTPAIDEGKQVFPGAEGKPAKPADLKGNASTPVVKDYALAIGVPASDIDDEAGRQDILDLIDDYKTEHPDWADRFASDEEQVEETPDNNPTTTPAKGDGADNEAPAKP